MRHVSAGATAAGLHAVVATALVAAAATVAIPSELHAQGLVAKGIRVGATKVVGSAVAADDYFGASAHRIGGRFGAFWTLWIAGGRLSLQPEMVLAYDHYRVELVHETLDESTGEPGTIDHGPVSVGRLRLLVPVLLKLNVRREDGKLVSPFIGAVVGTGLASTRVNAPGDVTTDGTPVVGAVLGIGVGFGRYAVDLRATGEFTYSEEVHWQPPAEECCSYFALPSSPALSASFAILW